MKDIGKSPLKFQAHQAHPLSPAEREAVVQMIAESCLRRFYLEKLAACVLRHLIAHRDGILAACDTSGPITEATRQASRDLAAVDEGLTRLGHFDTH